MRYWPRLAHWNGEVWADTHELLGSRDRVRDGAGIGFLVAAQTVEKHVRELGTVNCIAANEVIVRSASTQRAADDFDVSTIFAARAIGTAKFEPEKSDRIAKFTPMTFPVASNTGPPDPP
jgi:hypothetical protein